MKMMRRERGLSSRFESEKSGKGMANNKEIDLAG
jgi:hypothetical protein